MFKLNDLNKLEERLEKKLEGVVDKMEESSDQIYKGVTETHLGDIQKEPWNKIIFGFILTLMTIICGSTFYKVAVGGYWQEVPAYLSYLAYERVELSASNPRGPYDYNVSLRYTYRYNGKLYSGSNLYSDGNPLFNKVSYVEALLQNKKQGQEIIVHVDPQRPWVSAVVEGGYSPVVFLQLLGLGLIYGLSLLYSGRYLAIY